MRICTILCVTSALFVGLIFDPVIAKPTEPAAKITMPEKVAEKGPEGSATFSFAGTFVDAAARQPC